MLVMLKTKVGFPLMITDIGALYIFSHTWIKNNVDTSAFIQQYLYIVTYGHIGEYFDVRIPSI